MMDTATPQGPEPTAKDRTFADYSIHRAMIEDPRFYTPGEVRSWTDESETLFLGIPSGVRNRLRISSSNSNASPKRRFRVIIVEVLE